MDKIGWYINRISLLWTILVVISTGFVYHGQYWLVNPPVLSVVTILVVIYPWFVCHEQNWLVYYPVLSVMDNNGWYFSQIFLSLTKIGRYINRFCLS